MNVPFSSRIWTRLGLLAGPLVVALSLTTPAAAREPVDPATLNPPPPAEFNPVCFREGAHIMCDIAFSDPDIVDEPSGIVCDGTELLFSQTRAVVGKRFYDGDGDLLRRHFRSSLEGTYTNPETRLVALWAQTSTEDNQLAVPGDLSTGTTRLSGSIRVWIPGGGTILTDTGVTVLDGASGEILHASANHPFDDYFAFGDESALAPLCDALS
jgi:hypothetical protein